MEDKIKMTKPIMYLLYFLIGFSLMSGSFITGLACYSTPDSKLGMCFAAGRSYSIIGSSTKDTAWIKECRPYHREQIINHYCKVNHKQVDKAKTVKAVKKAKKIEKAKIESGCEVRSIKQYIETGAY